MNHQSYAQIWKTTIIKACNNAILIDKEKKKRSREEYLLKLQEPLKVWKFWPFYSVTIQRTPEQAEKFAKKRELEDAWLFSYLYPFTYAENLKTLAEASAQPWVYLCTTDANFVAKNL